MTPCKPEDILAESFRIIEENVGQHAFDAGQWPIARRMIHASGDLDLLDFICFHYDAVPAALCRRFHPAQPHRHGRDHGAGGHSPTFGRDTGGAANC